MKSILIKILSFFFQVFIKNSPPAVVENNLQNVADKLEKYDDTFFSYHLHPSNSDKVNKEPITSSFPKVAIVIQGPLLLDRNFTLESVKLYKKLFPEAFVIVSTWNDQDDETLRKIKEEGAHLVLENLPDNRGPLNVNLQIIGTQKGILKAKELGAQYVFKSRSDQRMYADNVVPALLGMLNAFPLTEETKLHRRIIVSGFTTLKYRPYGVGDMLMFGDVDDLLLYWSSNLDSRVINRDQLEGLTAVEYAKERLAETYLCTDFLQRIDYSLEWTLRDSWNVYKTFFCVVDNEMFDMYWYKHERIKSRRFDYYFPHGYQVLKFNDWVTLYSTDLNNLVIDESKLTVKEGRDF